jgi:hypothetical protein
MKRPSRGLNAPLVDSEASVPDKGRGRHAKHVDFRLTAGHLQLHKVLDLFINSKKSRFVRWRCQLLESSGKGQTGDQTTTKSDAMIKKIILLQRLVVTGISIFQGDHCTVRVEAARVPGTQPAGSISTSPEARSRQMDWEAASASVVTSHAAVTVQCQSTWANSKPEVRAYENVGRIDESSMRS